MAKALASRVRLPRYVRPRALAGAVIGYFWERPSWAKPPAEKFGRFCPVTSEALGTDMATAIAKGDLLNAQLDEWRNGFGGRPAAGTVKALFAWYRGLDRFTELSFSSRKGYRRAMDHAEQLKLKTTTLGELQVASITAVHADAFYKALVRQHGKRNGGYSMQMFRRVWNEAIRHDKAPKRNPFAKMGIKLVAEKGNRANSRAEYDVFRAQARELGLQSMATAAAIAFELVRRVSDVFGYIEELGDELDGIFWEDYRPGVSLAMRQGKTGTQQVIPLAGDDGTPLYPELEDELARTRTPDATGHIVISEVSGKRYDQREANRVFKRIVRSAGLPKEMTLTGFRHGGATELGDAGVVDIRAISGHKTLNQTATYNKATEEKARSAGVARRQHVAGKGA